MNNFEDLTVVIVTFKTNKKILSNCLESINKDVKVILVENNNDNLLKEEIEKTFSNVTVILSDTNLGYGGGNNLGHKNVNTRYMFISNPDTVYPKNFFSNLKDKCPQEAKILCEKLISNETIADIGIKGDIRRRFSKNQILQIINN